MPPRELTKHQVSSRLAYNPGQTPNFLLKLQQRVSGTLPDDEDDEEPSYGDEFEAGTSGRPPIPRRPPIPIRPKDQRGSGDERSGEDDRDGDEEGEEGPQVVVLKEGKHLSKLEVESEKRRAKGLPPLPEPSFAPASDSVSEGQSGGGHPPSKPKQPVNLSFSSGDMSKPMKKGKRKAVEELRDAQTTSKDKTGSKKKPKKAERKLLSFGDEA